MMKEKINLPLNPNSKYNLKKLENIGPNENLNANSQKNEEKRDISIEKINGDPKLNNQNNVLTL